MLPILTRPGFVYILSCRNRRDVARKNVCRRCSNEIIISSSYMRVKCQVQQKSTLEMMVLRTAARPSINEDDASVSSISDHDDTTVFPTYGTAVRPTTTTTTTTYYLLRSTTEPMHNIIVSSNRFISRRSHVECSACSLMSLTSL